MGIPGVRTIRSTLHVWVLQYLCDFRGGCRVLLESLAYS